MWMPDKEYYETLSKESKRDIEMVDYYTRQAERMNRLYKITKGKRGLFRFLNKWAYKQNQKYYKLGEDLALERLGILGHEMGYLIEYTKSFKYLEDKA